MDKQRAIALGTFDGLHRGHWEVLNGTKQDGFTPSALLFFEHPASVLAKSAPPALCTAQKRETLWRAAGVEP